MSTTKTDNEQNKNTLLLTNSKSPATECMTDGEEDEGAFRQPTYADIQRETDHRYRVN